MFLRDLVTISFNLDDHLGFKIINECGIFFLFFSPAAIVGILAQVKCRFAADRHTGDKTFQTSGRPESSVTHIMSIFNGNTNDLVEWVFDNVNPFVKAFDGIPINLSIGINCAIKWFRK